MGEGLKKFMISLQNTLKKVSASSQKVISDLDKANKKVEGNMSSSDFIKSLPD